MKHTPAQKEKAQRLGEVLYDINFDYRYLPKSGNPVATRSIRQYGTMPMDRAKRIREILNEEDEHNGTT